MIVIADMVQTYKEGETGQKVNEVSERVGRGENQEWLRPGGGKEKTVGGGSALIGNAVPVAYAHSAQALQESSKKKRWKNFHYSTSRNPAQRT